MGSQSIVQSYIYSIKKNSWTHVLMEKLLERHLPVKELLDRCSTNKRWRRSIRNSLNALHKKPFCKSIIQDGLRVVYLTEDARRLLSEHLGRSDIDFQTPKGEPYCPPVVKKNLERPMETFCHLKSGNYIT